MKFSETYQVTRTPEDDWFDPILTVDTRLFIDPFLLYASEDGVFHGSHAEVINFFNAVFQIVASSGGDKTSANWNRASDRLVFPEVSELCLGYTGGGTVGAGSGGGFARFMTETLWDAVRAGVTELRHFEEVGILGEGIGADRISDITACLLRRRLAEYTRDVCTRHNVPLTRFNFQRGTYDFPNDRWAPLSVDLPLNPSTQKAVLLVPRRYLRSLPTINADDFWDYCYTNDNEVLRRLYGDDITRHVDKKTIVDFARRHPQLRRAYQDRVESSRPTPYDLDRDQQGLVRWYDASAQYCVTRPLQTRITSQDTFAAAVEEMVAEFKHYVEQNNGWRLLTNDNGTPRKEKAAQDLFLGTVSHYCKANDIDPTRESNIGRGPVDFKMSHGFRMRVLHEVKLASNTRFWHGIQTQLPTYLRGERITKGYFIVIIQSEADLRRLTDIQDQINGARNSTGLDLQYVAVDSRQPASASRA